jgi:hypothetical protein
VPESRGRLTRPGKIVATSSPERLMTFRGHAATLIRTVGFFSLMLTVPVSLAGQTCFRGRPQPRCTGFTVLEFTGAVRLNDKTGPTDEAPAFIYWSGVSAERRRELRARCGLQGDRRQRRPPVWTSGEVSPLARRNHQHRHCTRALRGRGRQLRRPGVPQRHRGRGPQLWGLVRRGRGCGCPSPNRRRNSVARTRRRSVRQLARSTGHGGTWCPRGSDVLTERTAVANSQ